MNLIEAARLRDVDELNSSPSAEVIRSYIRESHPVVLRGAARDWPCVRDWSLEHLRNKVSQVKVQRPEKDGVYHYLKFDEVPFEELERSLTSTRDMYVTANPILGHGGKPVQGSGFDKLAPEVTRPEFLDIPNLESANLWIGPGGNRSLLHYDPEHSLMLMISGRKKFALFGPEQTDRMYAYGMTDVRAILEGRVLDSRVNPGDVDLQRFGRIAEAVGVTGEIGPGDLLLIPAGVWHYIESHDLNIAVNYWWWPRSVAAHMRRPLRDHWIKSQVLIPSLNLANRARLFLKELNPMPGRS